MQEEKYEEVWGALMGARDQDPTSINLYDSNRTLWNDTLDYINQYTDTGTSVSPEYYDVHKRLAGEPLSEGMAELMANYDPTTATQEQYNQLVSKWREANPKGPTETGNDHRNRAASAIRGYIASKNSREIVEQVERGDVRIMDTDKVSSIVASLMENPPPGLFENINNNYGILNDEAKREVLTSIVNSTVQSREMERYRDPETGEAIISTSDLGLDWYDESGNLKDDSDWWGDEDDGGILDNVITGRVTSHPFTNFGQEAQKGGRLEGVSIVDLINNKEFEDWVDTKGPFRMTRHGKNMFLELAGQFNNEFGRNPTVLEAMQFRKDGNLNLMSDDPSVGFTTSMNIRLIPENWIDNYNEPGQLEGIFALLNGGNVTPERAVARTSGWAKFGNIAGNIVASAAGAALSGGATTLGQKGGTAAAGGLGWK